MSEIITKEQFQELGARGPYSWFIAELDKLKVEEGIKITTEEWKQKGYKSLPTHLVHSAVYQIREGYKGKLVGKKFVTRTIEEGWIIFRIK